MSVFAVRYFGDQGEVSQVFRLTKSIALPGGNFLCDFNAAVTPKDKMAQICELWVLTPDRHVNMLDRQVWLWPVDEPIFAYNESPLSRTLMWVMLAASIILIILCCYLWKKKS